MKWSLYVWGKVVGKKVYRERLPKICRDPDDHAVSNDELRRSGVPPVGARVYCLREPWRSHAEGNMILVEDVRPGPEMRFAIADVPPGVGWWARSKK